MKDTILISYDIKNSDEYDYEQLYEYFKSFGTWASITVGFPGREKTCFTE